MDNRCKPTALGVTFTIDVAGILVEPCLSTWDDRCQILHYSSRTYEFRRREEQHGERLFEHTGIRGGHARGSAGRGTSGMIVSSSGTDGHAWVNSKGMEPATDSNGAMIRALENSIQTNSQFSGPQRLNFLYELITIVAPNY